MGSCCAKKDETSKLPEVKLKHIYCCDNIRSNCCIKTKHHRHKTTHSINNHKPNQHH